MSQSHRSLALALIIVVSMCLMSGTVAAVKPGVDPFYGRGRINIARALGLP